MIFFSNFLLFEDITDVGGDDNPPFLDFYSLLIFTWEFSRNCTRFAYVIVVQVL